MTKKYEMRAKCTNPHFIYSPSAALCGTYLIIMQPLALNVACGYALLYIGLIVLLALAKLANISIHNMYTEATKHELGSIQA